MPPSTEPHRPPEPDSSRDQPQRETSVIPIVEEEVSVARVGEKTGHAVRVRIESQEETRRIPVTETVEEVAIERVPINRYVPERTAAREEGNVVIIPVFETVFVVEERLILKEEIRIVRRQREAAREEEVVLRKDVPIIERRAAEEDEWREDRQDP